MEDDPLRGAYKEGLALRTGCDRRYGASTELGHHSTGQLMPMGVEIVEHEVNLPRRSVFSANGLDKVREDLRRAIRREVAVDLARGHLQTGGQAAGAVANVLVFDSFDTPGLGRLMRVTALKGLDAGFLIDTEDDFALF